jgi:hypothetical protein
MPLRGLSANRYDMTVKHGHRLHFERIYVAKSGRGVCYDAGIAGLDGPPKRFDPAHSRPGKQVAARRGRD